MCISSANPLIFKSTIEEQNRIMYRDPRTDVATMVGATIIAVDKRTTLASEGRSARTEGGQRAARRASIARAAGWARRARPRAWAPRAPAWRARRAAPSAAARCAREVATGAPCARAPPSPLGGTAIGRWLTLAPTELSKGAGNTLA